MRVRGAVETERAEGIAATERNRGAAETERAEGTGGSPLLMSPGPGCAVTSSLTSLRQAPGTLGELQRCRTASRTE